MTAEEQLRRWADGDSVHRATTNHDNLRRVETGWRCENCMKIGSLETLRASDCPNASGECTPDFSCCRPDLAVEIALRRQYVAATRDERELMLRMFLTGLLMSGA